jgi:catechol 2,3-dioxygenase-like lactoylglutathione lyase family enzyme
MSSATIGGLHLDIGLVTAEAQRARRFYRDVMQLSEAEPVPCAVGGTRYRFRAGSQWLSLCSLPTAPERQPGGLYDGIGYRVLAFFVDDLDALCARIVDFGGRVAKGVELPGRLRIRFAKDSDGNMLELLGLAEPAGDALEDRVQIGLTVADPERSRDFYGRVLGWPEHPQLPMPDDMTRYAFSAGSSTLKFWRREETLPNLAGAPELHTGIRFITLSVPDVARALDEAVARGATGCHDGARLGAEHSAWICDPDGNWIELAPGGPDQPAASLVSATALSRTMART